LTRKKVLVVDDEPHIVELVRLYLTKDGFDVQAARTGAEAIAKVEAERPDLVLLDLMLPEVDGWEVCRQLRRKSEVPIIMVTARTDDVDKIVGLELGADDYVGKPFNPRELLARVKAVLRRAPAEEPVIQAEGALVFGNTRIDAPRRQVTIAGPEGPRRVELRTKEFDLLVAFVRHLGLVLERDRLLNLVWGYDYFGGTRTVDVHVAHLRERLAGSSLSLETIRGVGYRMALDEEAD
jgi:two-component system alkaline phosphatase synthesis response regulator PhoP